MNDAIRPQPIIMIMPRAFRDGVSRRPREVRKDHGGDRVWGSGGGLEARPRCAYCTWAVSKLRDPQSESHLPLEFPRRA